ncbi:MAG: sigma-70 family RNA polymerase sigma factor [Planctomycetota bacterium]
MSAPDPASENGQQAPRSSRRAETAHRAADEAQLMARIAQHEEAAVGELYDRFGSLVYRMAVQAMPTRSDAEDAVQEVFVRLWRTADRYDADRSALVTWVMLISRRHLVDKLRRTRSRISAVSVDEPASLGEAASVPAGQGLVREESFERLLKKIESLPELQRTVVTRAYLGGQTLRQIGEELDTPLGTVKSALSRALVRLRERVGEELPS